MTTIRTKIHDYRKQFHTTNEPDKPSTMEPMMEENIPTNWTSFTYTNVWANTMIERYSRRQKKALKKYRQTKQNKISNSDEEALERPTLRM